MLNGNWGCVGQTHASYRARGKPNLRHWSKALGRVGLKCTGQLRAVSGGLFNRGTAGQIYACHERQCAAALGLLVWLLVAILMPRRAVKHPPPSRGPSGCPSSPAGAEELLCQNTIHRRIINTCSGARGCHGNHPQVPHITQGGVCPSPISWSASRLVAVGSGVISFWHHLQKSVF